MARIRSVKPPLFIHELLSELEESHPELRPMLVFIALKTQADKAGRFEWRPKQLKLGVLPFVNFDLSASMDLLDAHGFILRYEVNGRSYGFYPTWSKHEKPHHQEPESVIPAPEETRSQPEGGPAPLKGSPKPFNPSKKEGSKVFGDSPSSFAQEGEEEREREGEKEGEGEEEGCAGDAPRGAAAASAIPEWLLEELKTLGIHGAQAKALGVKLGPLGTQAALAKIRAKKGEKNPAGLLVKKGPELAEEGRAILSQQLERAMKLAPKAFEDPKWGLLPEQLRQDPEVRAAWCGWKAADSARKGAGEHMLREANQNVNLAMELLLPMLEARHPQRKGMKQLTDAKVATHPPASPFMNATLIRWSSFWGALEPELAACGGGR